METNFKGLLSMVSGAVLLVVCSASTWASDIPLDNRLFPIVNDDPTKISFTDVFIRKAGRRNRDSDAPSWFRARSTDTSTFTLDGPGFEGVSFNGFLKVNAKITPLGEVTQGSLAIYSSDPLFGFDCSAASSECRRNKGLVFGADLVDFGWSGTEGILEFVESNLSGWAADLWQNNNGDERLLFFSDPFQLGNLGFKTLADGIAIVPVPAAVWLFGSGLLGLAGIARRKKQVL